MDVRNRDKAEKEMNEVLFIVWNEWSKTKDPSTLTEESLMDLLEKNCRDAVWAVWVRANLDLLKEFDKEQEDASLAAAFMLFFMNWKRKLSERWMTRVQDWQYERDQQEAERNRIIAIQQNQPSTTIQPNTTSGSVQSSPTGGSKKPEPIVIPAAPLEWKDARKEVVQEYDIERESVTSVTEIHTNGEQSAADEIGSEEYILPFWKTEPGACDFCSPLDDQPPSVWRAVSLGPPAHPHCVLGDTAVCVPNLKSCFRGVYSGKVYRIVMADSSRFTVTENHTFLSKLGFVRSVDLNEGDQLIQLRGIRDAIHWEAASIFSDCRSIAKHFEAESESPYPYIHGDSHRLKGRYELLRIKNDSISIERAMQFGSSKMHQVLDEYYRTANFARDLDRDAESMSNQNRLHSNRRYLEGFCLMTALRPDYVSACSIRSIEIVNVEGEPVFDFETESTVYSVGNGIVSSNCRCWLEWRRMVE